MKVVVLGLWHLGCVTAACCAKFVDVIGLDYDEQTIHDLRAGQPPIFEPGLADLIQDRASLATFILRVGSSHCAYRRGSVVGELRHPCRR